MSKTALTNLSKAVTESIATVISDHNTKVYKRAAIYHMEHEFSFNYAEFVRDWTVTFKGNKKLLSSFFSECNKIFIKNFTEHKIKHKNIVTKSIHTKGTNYIYTLHTLTPDRNINVDTIMHSIYSKTREEVIALGTKYAKDFDTLSSPDSLRYSHDTSASSLGTLTILMDALKKVGVPDKEAISVIDREIKKFIAEQKIKISDVEKAILPKGMDLTTALELLRNSGTDKYGLAVRLKLVPHQVNKDNTLETIIPKVFKDVYTTNRFLRDVVSGTPYLRGSPSIIDIIRQKLRDAFKGITQPKKVYKSTGKNTKRVSELREEPKVIRSEKKKELEPIKPTPNLDRIVESNTSIAPLIPLIEELTKVKIERQMEDSFSPPSKSYLRYQTGRFKNSFEITSADRDTIVYKYLFYPYEVFDPAVSSRPDLASQGRNPRRYIEDNLRLAAQAITRRTFNIAQEPH